MLGGGSRAVGPKHITHCLPVPTLHELVNAVKPSQLQLMKLVLNRDQMMGLCMEFLLWMLTVNVWC